MRIGIPAEGEDLSAQVSSRFARAPWFLLVDPETGEVEALKNQATAASHGAGGQAVQELARHDVSVVLAPRVGPKAADSLSAAGMSVYEAADCTCSEALEAYKAGKLPLVQEGR
jgi:predicted Fe-Mo cluster-binding NifX family protein